MELDEVINCSVKLALGDVSESDVSQLIRLAKSSGLDVIVRYLPRDKYTISVEFGDDLDHAQALVSEARRLRDASGDYD